MTETAEALRQTVRVLPDGTAVRGIAVPHAAANVRGDTRYTASTPKRARASTFRGHAGFPGDTWLPDRTRREGVRRTDILGVTHPHDCANHIPGMDDEVTHYGLRLLAKAQTEEVAA